MNKALKDYKCDGQLSIFDFIKVQCSFSGHECNKEELWKVADTLDEIMCPHVCCRNCEQRLCGARCNGSEEPQEPNHDCQGDPDYHGAMDEITRYSIENDFELSIKLTKCPECLKEPEKLFKSCHEYWLECPKCGRATERFKKMYQAMQAWNRGELSAPHTPQIYGYLRYGPHTLIPQVRAKARAWLDRYGVPEWVEWEKDSLPCENCTWYDGTKCCSGGHTNHFEYGYLICDGFYQSCVERKPSTVGDSFPNGIEQKPHIYPLDIKGICDDPYCPQCGYAFETTRSSKGYEVDCERCPECHVKVDWTPWHRLNDDEPQA